MSQLPSSLPGIDVSSGLARVAGNSKLYLKLLRHVAADAPATRQRLADALGKGDATFVREQAHSLKGAAANLSITDVAAAAADLEAAARDNDGPAMARHLASLDQALELYTGIVATMDDIA